MSNMIPFTSNYEDKSNEFGYQFEFHCQRCNNGYESTFQPSASGIGGNLLQNAGNLLGGIFERVNNINVSDMMRSQARDAALRKAVEEMKPFFSQCPRCGVWVCKQVCWNDQTQLCAQCSPKVTQEVAAMQSQAQLQQLQEKVQKQDFTAGVDVKNTQVGQCPHCGAASQGGKFCASCGQPLATKTTCSKCNAEIAAGAKFCANCGASTAQ